MMDVKLWINSLYKCAEKELEDEKYGDRIFYLEGKRDILKEISDKIAGLNFTESVKDILWNGLNSKNKQKYLLKVYNIIIGNDGGEWLK